MVGSISVNERNEEERKEEEAMEISCSDCDESYDGSDSDSDVDDYDSEEEEANRPPRFDLSVKFPPEWEEDIEKSPQYLCGMIHRFVKPWNLETLPPTPDSEFKYPPIYRGPKIQNVHHKLITRIKAIRESRGYDVEPGIPYFFLGDPFFPVRLQNTETYDKEFYDKIMEFVLEQINSHAQAQGCDKRYELVEIEKIVEARAHRVELITLRAKELSVIDAAENMHVEKTVQAMVYTEGCCDVFRLLEWRFKPPQPT